MVDLDRFVGDGMGTKINRLIKSMQIITEQVQTNSLGVVIENSIAFPLHSSVYGTNISIHTALLVSGELTNAGATSSYPQLVIEFFPQFIKSKQQGVLLVTGSVTTTINQVVPENTLLIAGGEHNSYTNSNNLNITSGRGSLNGGTKIEFSAGGLRINGGSGDTPRCNVGWVCLEFVGGVL